MYSIVYEMTLPQTLNKQFFEACAAINRHFSIGFRDHRNFQHLKLIKRGNGEIETRCCEIIVQDLGGAMIRGV